MDVHCPVRSRQASRLHDAAGGIGSDVPLGGGEGETFGRLGPGDAKGNGVGLGELEAVISGMRGKRFSEPLPSNRGGCARMLVMSSELVKRAKVNLANMVQLWGRRRVVACQKSAELGEVWVAHLI